MLKKKEETDEMVVNYSLSDTVFAKAKVKGDIVRCCRRVVMLKGLFSGRYGGRKMLFVGRGQYHGRIQLRRSYTVGRDSD
jgi:hypothetical protein